MVESNEPFDRIFVPPQVRVPTQESCHITRDEPQLVELEVQLRNRALVVLSDFYDPDWKATVRHQDDGTVHDWRVLRTNRIMRGVFLPPGRHTITYRYQPTSFYGAAIICLASWVALFLSRTMRFVRRLKGQPIG